MVKNKKRNLICIEIITALVFSIALSGCNSEMSVQTDSGVQQFYEIAQPAAFPPEAPKLSDVCMRLFHVRGDITEDRIIEAGKGYHITQGVWSYYNNRKFIERVHSLGWKFQGSLLRATNDPECALLDRDGNPLTYDHGTQYWPDPSSEKFRKAYLDQAKGWIDSGVDSLQRDDPDFGIWDWHGKRESISDDVFLEFNTWARNEIEKYAGRKLTISVNFPRDKPFMQCFDYRMAELRFHNLNPSYLMEMSRKSRKQGLLNVATGQEDVPVEEFRKAIAGCYATGNLYVMPWDQFNRARLKDANAKRIFIAPEKLADLTGFIRASSQYLDGYEDAAVGGYGLTETRYGDQPPVVVEGGSGQLTALVRARPGDAAAPLVVHLVEWGEATPIRIKIPSQMLFGGAPIRAQIRQPEPYNADAHVRAEATHDYRPLVHEKALSPTIEGDCTVFQIPACTPWSMLFIEQDR